MRHWLYSIVALGLFLFISYLVIAYLLPFLFPFAIAIILALMIDPVVDYAQFKLRIPRGLGAAAVMLILIALTGVVLVIGVARLVAELLSLAAFIRASVLRLDPTQLRSQFQEIYANLPPDVQATLVELAKGLGTSLYEMLPSLADTLSTLAALPSLIAILAIAFIATYFFSRDKRIISRFLLSLAPPGTRDKILDVKTDVFVSALGFAKAQLVLIILTMIITIIGLSLIGARYSLVLGLLVGFADVLPIVGPSIVFGPWIIYNLAAGSVPFALRLLVVFVLISVFRQVAEAKVVGERIGLHPLATLFSIFVGFKVFGALGFVAGPLLAIVLKAMIKSGLLPAFPGQSSSK